MRKFDALPVARNCKNLDDSRLIKISQAENRGSARNIRCLSTNDSQFTRDCGAKNLMAPEWKRQISTSVRSPSISRRFLEFKKVYTIFRINFTFRRFWFSENECDKNEKNIEKIRFLFPRIREGVYDFWNKFYVSKILI